MAIENRECFLTNWRDALKCRVCGRGPNARETYHRGFEYHHLQHQAHGGPGIVENLILLCHDCHTRHHQNQLHLPDFSDEELQIEESLICAQCQAPNDPRTIEMNCGWYRCGQCRQRVHLFDHFCYED